MSTTSTLNRDLRHLGYTTRTTRDTNGAIRTSAHSHHNADHITVLVAGFDDLSGDIIADHHGIIHISHAETTTALLGLALTEASHAGVRINTQRQQ